MKTIKLLMFTVVAVTLLFSHSSRAGLIECSEDLANNYVTNTLDCAISTADNDSVSQVNADGFFSINTWEQLFKVEEEGDSGSFSFNFDTTGYTIMVVF